MTSALLALLLLASPTDFLRAIGDNMANAAQVVGEHSFMLDPVHVPHESDSERAQRLERASIADFEASIREKRQVEARAKGILRAEAEAALFDKRRLLAQVRSSNPPITVAPVVKSTGCGTTAPFTGTTTQTSPTNGVPQDGVGNNRAADWIVPAGYSNSVARPLVLVFHEFGGTSAGAEGWGITTNTALATTAGAIFIVPQAITNNFGVGWDASLGTASQKAYFSSCPGCVPAQNGKDTAWAASLVAFALSHFCIDSNRVFAAGFSMGGDMVTSLAFGTTTYRAVSIVAAGGDFVPDATGDYRDYLNWKVGATTGGPTAVRHAYDDSGGDAAGGGNVVPDLFTARNLYRILNRCSTQVSASAGSCNEYVGCAARTLDCPVNLLGHARPTNWGTDTANWFLSFGP